MSSDRASAVEGLLEQLLAAPQAAGERVARALDSDERDAIREALRSDPRFGPPLHEAIRDLDQLRANKWLVQFLGHLRYAPAVPELLAAWRSGIAGLDDQAGHALLRIGGPDLARTLAADFPEVRGTAAGIALRSGLSLPAAEAYELLAPFVSGLDARTSMLLYQLSSEPAPLAEEPRWLRLAVEASRAEDPRVQAAARELLIRRVAADELARAFPQPTPEEPDPDRERRRDAALDRARATMTKLRARLRPDVWAAPPPERPDQLAELELRFGRLPAGVRAFYEQIDGLEIPAARAAERFILYPLAAALTQLQRWEATTRPDTTPAQLWPPFELPVAPDANTRAGRSGGPDVAVVLPNDEDDPRLVHLSRPPRWSAFVRRALG